MPRFPDVPISVPIYFLLSNCFCTCISNGTNWQIPPYFHKSNSDLNLRTVLVIIFREFCEYAKEKWVLTTPTHATPATLTWLRNCSSPSPCPRHAEVEGGYKAYRTTLSTNRAASAISTCFRPEYRVPHVPVPRYRTYRVPHVPVPFMFHDTGHDWERKTPIYLKEQLRRA